MIFHRNVHFLGHQHLTLKQRSLHHSFPCLSIILSAFVPNGPIEDANGRLDYRAHHVSICGAHRVDSKEKSFPEYRLSRFVPPSKKDTPNSLFINKTPRGLGMDRNRFIRLSNPSEILIYTDGSCFNNGQKNPKAGLAFVFNQLPDGQVSFRLETYGPTNKRYVQTSNRAELQAVIAALEYRKWDGEGWKHIVIASDSEYVVNGATNWVYTWMVNGWRTYWQTPVKNRDLWERLLHVCAKRSEPSGLRISFWRIPRELNRMADLAAKETAKGTEKELYVGFYR